jgi:hypothetical protein
MSFQPWGGICWGCSAWRPCPSPATALGSVSWLAEGPPPAAAPSPPGASVPPGPFPWPFLALPPPAVLRPTSTAVASMPTRRPDLAILRVSPGRFPLFFAALATAPPCRSKCEQVRNFATDARLGLARPASLGDSLP